MPEHYGECINESLLEFMGPLGGTVLDLGCGVGNWAAALRAAGAAELLGVEPSHDAVVAALNYDRVYVDPIESVGELPYVDVVIAADVLEHLTDPWKVLRVLRESTVQGGTLFVSVPNFQCVKALVALASGRFPYDDGGFWDQTHLHWFTRRSLEGSLVDAGWTPTSWRFVFGRGKRQQLSRASGGVLDPFLGHQLQMKAEAI